MNTDLLNRVPLFSGMSEDDLRKLYQMSELVKLDAGQELFSEGSDGDRAYVLIEGQLEITKTSSGRPVLISVRTSPGDLVGEMALLEQAPRMATVRARAASVLLAIRQQEFDGLLATSPSAARAVFRTVISRLRDTEGMLRQSEKMAQLGTLTAGVAHELNNPAAAVKRSAAQLNEAIGGYDTWPSMAIGEGPGRLQVLRELRQRAIEKAEHQTTMDPIESSDRESEVAAWMRQRGLADAAVLAPTVAGLGYDSRGLSEMEGRLAGVEFQSALRWMCATYSVHRLLKEIGEGAGRISEIVKALRSYSFLDQAPLQSVDVHEGLENTLLILGHKLKGGIEIRRDYARDLPRIEAYGSELNQVWTNIIDNAADALQGSGTIAIRTRAEGDWVVVEIEDNGPGIPSGTRERVFDAFFTTKPPGQGTGLGLNISYKIVVNRHQGDIKVSSEPGRTCFQVWLPARRKVADRDPAAIS